MDEEGGDNIVEERKRECETLQCATRRAEV
jgi:hypothetical protein